MSKIEEKYPPAAVSEARRLPDSDFYDHPEIAPLKAEWDKAAEERALAAAFFQAHQLDLTTWQRSLEELITQEAEVRAGFAGLAAVDLGNGDPEFTASVDGRICAQTLAFRIEGAREVVAILEARSEELQRPIRFAAERGKSLDIRIKERLWPLKLQAAYLARCCA